MEDRNRVYYRWKQYRHEPRYRDICVQVDFASRANGFICHHCGERIQPRQEASLLFPEIEKGMLYAMHRGCAEEICDPATKPPIEVFPLPPTDGIHQMNARLAGSPTRRVVYTYTVPWSMYGEEGTEYAFVPQAPGFLCHVCDKEISLGVEAYIIASKNEPGVYYTLCNHGRRSCKPKGPEDALYPGEDEDAWEI